MQCRIPLGHLPQLAAAASARHGRAGRRWTEKYHLPDFWCLHVYRYEAHMTAGGFPIHIQPGLATILPPDTPLEYHYRGLSPHLYAHFRLTPSPDAIREIPMRLELGDRLMAVESDLHFMASQLAGNPLRANIRLWDLLWSLVELSGRASRQHPALERAIGLIELRLAEPMEISRLSREVGLSHNHLIRLFKAEFGLTVSGYIRRRRRDRAQHLLSQTSLPVKVIASQVGLPDLRSFNAFFKHECGEPPRLWRTNHSSG